VSERRGVLASGQNTIKGVAMEAELT